MSETKKNALAAMREKMSLKGKVHDMRVKSASQLLESSGLPINHLDAWSHRLTPSHGQDMVTLSSDLKEVVMNWQANLPYVLATQYGLSFAAGLTDSAGAYGSAIIGGVGTMLAATDTHARLAKLFLSHDNLTHMGVELGDRMGTIYDHVGSRSTTDTTSMANMMLSGVTSRLNLLETQTTIAASLAGLASSKVAQGLLDPDKVPVLLAESGILTSVAAIASYIIHKHNFGPRSQELEAVKASWAESVSGRLSAHDESVGATGSVYDAQRHARSSLVHHLKRSYIPTDLLAGVLPWSAGLAASIVDLKWTEQENMPSISAALYQVGVVMADLYKHWSTPGNLANMAAARETARAFVAATPLQLN